MHILCSEVMVTVVRLSEYQSSDPTMCPRYVRLAPPTTGGGKARVKMVSLLSDMDGVFELAAHKQSEICTHQVSHVCVAHA